MKSLFAQTSLILRNDLRLLWRDFRTAPGLTSSLGLLGVFFVLTQLISIVLFIHFRTPPSLAIETGVWFFFTLMMVAAAISHAVRVLFERADFDLLVSSPVSSRAILLARLLAIAAGATLNVALLLAAILNGAIIAFSWKYVCGYLVWLFLGLVGASAGVWITLLFVRCFGPRRARMLAQVLAVVLATTLALAFLGQSLLSREWQDWFPAALTRTFENPALSIIARATRGGWLALTILAALSAIFAFLTIRLLSRVFISGVQEAGIVKSTQRSGPRYRFGDGIARATFRKDLRLIARDPLLLSKVLPPVLYLLPVLFVVGRAVKVAAPALLASYTVFVTAVLSLQFITVAIGGEESWDMVRSSPASTVRIRIAKIIASMGLPVVVCVVTSIVIAFLGRPGLALTSLTTALVCASAACWVEAATIRPTARKDLIQRSYPGRLLSVGQVGTAIVFFIGGSFGVGLAACGRWQFSGIVLGLVGTVAVMCFALVKPKDLEIDATA